MGDSPSQHQSDTEMAQADGMDAALGDSIVNAVANTGPQEGTIELPSPLLTFSLRFPFDEDSCPSPRAESSSTAEDRPVSASTSSRQEPHLAPLVSLPEAGNSSAHMLGAAPSQSAAHTSFSPWNREPFQPGPVGMPFSRLRHRLTRRERLKRTSPPGRRRSPMVPKRQRLSEEISRDRTEEISQDRTCARYGQSNNTLPSTRSSETISSGAGPSAGLDALFHNERSAPEPDSQHSSNGGTTHAAVSQAERVIETPLGLQRSSEPVPPPPFPTCQESSPVPEADSTSGRPSRGTRRIPWETMGPMSELQGSPRVPPSPQSRPSWTSLRPRPLIPFHRRMDHSYLSYNRESPRPQLTPQSPGFLPNRTRFYVRDLLSTGAAQAPQRPPVQSPRDILNNFLILADEDSPSASALDQPPLSADALPRVPRSTSGSGAPDASLGMSRNLHGRTENRSTQFGGPRASLATDAILGAPGRTSSRPPGERNEALSEVAQYLERRRAAYWNEGQSSGAANSAPVESSAAPQGSRTLREVYDDVVSHSRFNVDEFFSRLDNSMGSSSSSSSSSSSGSSNGSGSGTDAGVRSVPLMPSFLELSDGEEVIMVHDSESESDSEGSSTPPPVELPLRGPRSGPDAPGSGPPRPGSGPAHRMRVLSPPPDYSLPFLNDYLQYETDEDLARRLQEEADRELAMSLSRNIGQMHDGEDDFLRGMNLNSFMNAPPPPPRQPEAGPQVSSSAEATPSGGARTAPFESRFPAQEHREREEMRARRESRYRQDRHLTSPILLRLSPGSRQLVLRFHNARRIAAERAAGDDPLREGLDRLHGYELLLELTAEMGEIKPRGATSAEIGLIPEMKYQAWRETTRGADAAPEKDECIICMVELEDSHDLRVLNCTHYFHKLCIDKWLLSCATCPVCRDDIRGGKA